VRELSSFRTRVSKRRFSISRSSSARKGWSCAARAWPSGRDMGIAHAGQEHPPGEECPLDGAFQGDLPRELADEKRLLGGGTRLDALDHLGGDEGAGGRDGLQALERRWTATAHERLEQLNHFPGLRIVVVQEAHARLRLVGLGRDRAHDPRRPAPSRSSRRPPRETARSRRSSASLRHRQGPPRRHNPRGRGHPSEAAGVLNRDFTRKAVPALQEEAAIRSSGRHGVLFYAMQHNAFRIPLAVAP
jgi:hypothetical protein